MYFNSGDRSSFLASEFTQLKAARDSAIRTSQLAKAAWNRAEAAAMGSNLVDPDAAETHALAMQERFRAAHEVACALKDEVAELEYEMGMDEEYDEAA